MNKENIELQERCMMDKEKLIWDKGKTDGFFPALDMQIYSCYI